MSSKLIKFFLAACFFVSCGKSESYKAAEAICNCSAKVQQLLDWGQASSKPYSDRDSSLTAIELKKEIEDCRWEIDQKFGVKLEDPDFKRESQKHIEQICPDVMN